MATLLLLLVKMCKITNISKTVRDRVIFSEFLIHRVVQEYPVPGEKFYFSHFWQPTWILVENKTLKISQTR